MCGIAGYIGKKKIDKSTINGTLFLMKNRGPDNQDFKHFKQGNINIYLLHSRLSIIDLDDRANQPFTLEGCTLVFNGEIYNYIELKQDLKRQGIECTTNSDTEVLLRYYLLYGENCVNYFEGMWSFVIYDSQQKILFLSRDRFAEKPLYYYQNKDGFYFSSEIKFMKKLASQYFTLNNNQLLRYLINGYKSLYKYGETFYREIDEIPYASNLIVDHDLNLTCRQYWKPGYSPKIMTTEEAIEGIRDRLINSIKLRLRADVPLAFCLSGGIDSSGLVSIASKIFNYDAITYSIIDSDKRYNEYNNIKTTINDLGCRHKFIYISQKGNLERLRKLIQYHDGPLATISYLIHSYISETISNDGYKIAISGTAADEMFTGYYDHFNLYLYEMRHHPDYKTLLRDWQTNISKFVRNPFLKDAELYFNNPNFRDHIYLNNRQFSTFLKKDFSEPFIEENYSESLLRNRMLNEMFHEGTRVILHEDDLNSMLFSVENRSPYLDKNLFEFAYSIPNELLIKEGYGKYILREAMRGILNDQVRLDRRKRGFNASIKSLVNFKNKRDRDYLLDNSPIYDFIDKNKIEKLFDMDMLPNSYSKFLFNFFNSKILLEEK